MTDPVHVLWTGGWDSTFRVLSLAVAQKRAVQPHYIVDPGRSSRSHELRSIRSISEAAHREYGAGLLRQTEVVELDSLRVSERATARHRALAERFGIGEQYVWLGEYARQIGIPSLELCIHVDDKAYSVVESARSHSGEAALPEPFDRFHFPVLDLSKREMLAIAREQGFDGLMALSWFCHIPTRSGRPCGICNPCRWTASEGLAYRLPFSAKARSLADSHGIARIPGFRLRRALRSALRRFG